MKYRLSRDIDDPSAWRIMKWIPAHQWWVTDSKRYYSHHTAIRALERRN